MARYRTPTARAEHFIDICLAVAGLAGAVGLVVTVIGGLA